MVPATCHNIHITPFKCHDHLKEASLFQCHVVVIMDTCMHVRACMRDKHRPDKIHFNRSGKTGGNRSFETSCMSAYVYCDFVG